MVATLTNTVTNRILIIEGVTTCQLPSRADKEITRKSPSPLTEAVEDEPLKSGCQSSTVNCAPFVATPPVTVLLPVLFLNPPSLESSGLLDVWVEGYDGLVLDGSGRVTFFPPLRAAHELPVTASSSSFSSLSCSDFTDPALVRPAGGGAMMVTLPLKAEGLLGADDIDDGIDEEGAEGPVGREDVELENDPLDVGIPVGLFPAGAPGSEGVEAMELLSSLSASEFCYGQKK